MITSAHPKTSEHRFNNHDDMSEILFRNKIYEGCSNRSEDFTFFLLVLLVKFMSKGLGHNTNEFKKLISL